MPPECIWRTAKNEEKEIIGSGNANRTEHQIERGENKSLSITIYPQDPAKAIKFDDNPD